VYSSSFNRGSNRSVGHQPSSITQLTSLYPSLPSLPLTFLTPYPLPLTPYPLPLTAISFTSPAPLLPPWSLVPTFPTNSPTPPIVSVQCKSFQGSAVADWYYIGHYGQLGPLTKEQVDELVDGGVIARETYVWSTGMAEWLPADRVTELRTAFDAAQPFAAPPPAPNLARVPPPQPMQVRAFGGDGFAPVPQYGGLYSTVRSDRNRSLAGILQLLIPGVGRMYLGYAAYGVLQLFFALCGVGILWSIVDGIIILTGGVKLDGYGRQLPD
jgi:hypothetical protein